ncbi:MAG: hypothetical protein ABI148_07635 [Ginsengibacter sp.]
MKKNLLISSTLIVLVGLFIISCAKENLKATKSIQNNTIEKTSVNPNVLDCGTGYHWDYGLKKCVANNCQSGYHWDGTQGKCVFTQITVITNSNNPDDSAGARHNQAVNSIMGEVSSDNSIDEIIQFTLNYLKPFNYDTTELRSDYNLSVSLGTFGYTNVDSLANKMYAISEISSAAKNYMLDLSSLLENVIGENDPTDSIYITFADDATSYEGTIAIDNSLPANEKTMLLSAFSVARYSAAYWGNYIQNNSSVGLMSSNLTEVELLKLSKFWKKVIGADAAGAITGSGAAIETSKSVVRGGIFGAIIGSVSTAVKELVSPS